MGVLCDEVSSFPPFFLLQSNLPQGMQAGPMWKKEVKLDKREKALAAH